MSLTSRRNGTGRIYVRKFDHEEAVSRHKAGESIGALAREYGVSYAAVWRVVTPGYKEHDIAKNRAWRRGICQNCRGPAMRLVSAKKIHNPDGRTLCARCRSRERRERLRFDDTGKLIAVRCIRRDCANGERWQPPEHFPRGTRFRDVREGGIHSECRACNTRSKQRYRAAHPEYRRRNGGHQTRAAA